MTLSFPLSTRKFYEGGQSCVFFLLRRIRNRRRPERHQTAARKNLVRAGYFQMEKKTLSHKNPTRSETSKDSVAQTKNRRHFRRSKKTTRWKVSFTCYLKKNYISEIFLHWPCKLMVHVVLLPRSRTTTLVGAAAMLAPLEYMAGLELTARSLRFLI